MNKTFAFYCPTNFCTKRENESRRFVLFRRGRFHFLFFLFFLFAVDQLVLIAQFLFQFLQFLLREFIDFVFGLNEKKDSLVSRLDLRLDLFDTFHFGDVEL